VFEGVLTVGDRTYQVNALFYPSGEGKAAFRSALVDEAGSTLGYNGLLSEEGHHITYSVATRDLLGASTGHAGPIDWHFEP
jgi:hypothetical protein